MTRTRSPRKSKARAIFRMVDQHKKRAEYNRRYRLKHKTTAREQGPRRGGRR